MFSGIKSFWEKYETKIVLILGFVLVSGLSFEAGLLKGADFSQKPLVIESASSAVNCPSGKQNASLEVAGASKTSSVGSVAGENINNASENTAPESQNCALVGSKNSNKYHLPNCRYAKNINPENRVCFSSADDAKSRGYLPDKNCIK